MTTFVLLLCATSLDPPARAARQLHPLAGSWRVAADGGTLGTREAIVTFRGGKFEVRGADGARTAGTWAEDGGAYVLRWSDGYEDLSIRVSARGGRLRLKDGRLLAVRMRE